MKNFLRVLKFVVNAVAFVIVMSTIVLMIKGYRVVNVEETKVDWLAINALADLIVPFIISGITIIATLLTTKCIDRTRNLPNEIKRYLDSFQD